MTIHNTIAETLASLRGTPAQPTPPAEPTDLADTVPATLSLSEIAEITDRATTPRYDGADDFSGIEYKAPILPQVGTIPFHLWESLAYDLALGHPPSEELATAYSSTLEDLVALIESPYFSKLLSAKREEVAEVGPRASTVTKFRVITSMGMREYMRRVTSPNTSDKDFHALFKLALEMGELTPPPAPKDGGVQIDIGNNADGMTFNIYGIPGLDHVQNLRDVTPQTVDVNDIDVVDINVVDTTDTTQVAPQVMETL